MAEHALTIAPVFPSLAPMLPSLAPLPYLGMTQSEKQLQAAVPGLQSAPTVFAPAPDDATNRLPSLGWLGQQTGGALGADNDPSTWTPEEAASQTDKALARIAQANPELAQSLAEQRGKSAAEGEDLPWYKDLLKGLGDFLHATKLDVAFEVLGRAGKIVPEIIHDWNKESVWENFGDALSGKSTISWDDVLVDKFGMERSWLTAVLGFAGDVATDPITYLTFGMGGVGRAVVGKTVATASLEVAISKGSIGVARTLVKEGTEKGLASAIGKGAFTYADDVTDLSVLTKEIRTVLSEGGKRVVGDDEVARAIFGLTESSQQGFMAGLKKALGRAHPDARPGVAFTIDSVASKDALLQSIRFMDDTYRTATTTGWQRVTKEAAAKMGVDKSLVDDVLKSYVRQGTGFNITKPLYTRGKGAAAGIGGARLRFSLPGFNMRMAGLRLPFLPKRLDFSAGRRMFAGLSGQVRLMKMVGAGEATMEDMRIFWERGWKGLNQLSPGVARKVGKGHRSMFYTVSEGLGKGTRHFSPSHMQLRGGGLAAKYAGDVRKQASHMRAQVADEILTVDMGEGNILNKNQVGERLAKAAKNADGVTREEELLDNLNELRRLMPDSGSADASAYFNGRIEQLTLAARRTGSEQSEEFLAAREVLRKQLKEAQVAETQVLELGGDQELGRIWRTLAENRDNVKRGAGQNPDTVADDIVQLDDLNTEDALRHTDGDTWRSDDVVTSGEIGEELLSDNGVTGVAARGARFTRAGRVGDAVDMGETDSVIWNDLVQDLSGGKQLFGADLAEGSLARKVQTNGHGTWAKMTKGLSGEELDEVAGALDRARREHQGIIARSSDAAAAAGEASTPVRRLIDALDRDVADAITTHLDSLTMEELSYFRNPRVVLTGRRRTLTIDRATKTKPGTEATSVIDKVAEIEAAYRPILEQMQEGSEEMLEEFDEGAVEVIQKVLKGETGIDAQLAAVTTALLKDRGYTDLRIITDAGEEMVVFWDDTHRAFPVSRINPHAANYGAGGSQLRGVTKAAHEAISGVDPRKGSSLMTKIQRAVRDMPRKRAEVKALDMMAREGIPALRQGQTFFENGVVRTAEDGARRAAGEVQQEFLGRAMRHADNLGLMRGGYGSGAVGLGRYRVMPSEGGMAWAKNASAKEKLAAERAAELSDELIPKMRNEAERLTDEYNVVNNSLDFLSDNSAARERIVAMSRRVEAKVMPEARSGAKIADQDLTPEQLVPGAPLVDKAGYAYHIGHADRHGVITEQGLHPQNIFEQVPGMAGAPPRLFLANSLERAQDLASPGNKVVYRIKGSTLKQTEPERLFSGSQVYRQVVGAKDIEFLGIDDKWHKLVPPPVDRSVLKRESNQLKGRIEKTERQLHNAMVQQTEAINEARRLEYRTGSDRAPVLVALVRQEDPSWDMTGMAAIDLPGFEEFRMPAFMAEEFSRATNGFKQLEGPHLAFRQFNNWWKMFATWLVPAFHIRNAQGAFFNNWLSGNVHLGDYIAAGRVRRAERELAKGGQPGKWAAMKVVDKDKELAAALRFSEPTGFVNGVYIDDLTYADLAQMTAELNLTASNGRLFAEAQLSAEAETIRQARKVTSRSWARRIPEPYTRVMRGSGTLTENVFRTASFVGELRNGRSILDARGLTMMRHGDYEDLTDFEYTWMRDLIPFYKWMRTNTPFQVHQLLESPGKLLAVQKAQQALYAGQGLDYEVERHRMPSWMGEGFTIPFNKGETVDGQSVYDTVMLDLPMSDLFMGGREFVSSFLPTIRPFLESYVYGQQTFSGTPLTGKKVPLALPLGPLAPVLDVVGLTETGPDGERYVSAKTNNLLGVIPLYSRFKSFIYADENAVTRRSNAVASAVFGFQLRPVDQESLTSTELNFYYDQVLPTMEALRDVGYPLPTMDDLTDTIGTTDQILTSLGIKPGLVEAAA